MPCNERCWRGIAGVNGLIAVVMGAVAAHALPGGPAAALAEKASLYQLIHAAVLLHLCAREGRNAGFARWAFLAGIVLFCGSLYLKAISGWASATVVAPAGGMSLMAGWLLVALS